MTENNENNQANPNLKLKIAKVSVFILTALLFATGAMIVIGVSKNNKNEDIKSIPSSKVLDTSMKLGPDSRIKSSFSCGKYLCINIINSKDEEKIIIINPDNLSEIKTLKFY